MKKPTTVLAVGFVEIYSKSVATNPGHGPYYQDRYDDQIYRNQFH